MSAISAVARRNICTKSLVFSGSIRRVSYGPRLQCARAAQPVTFLRMYSEARPSTDSKNAPGGAPAPPKVVSSLKEAKDEAAAQSADAAGEPKATPAKAEEKPKLTLWQKIKHEAQHYWDGTKLLAYEVQVSTKLAAKMWGGHELTRRESRQLKRTTQDIVRLVPFSMFVIVPFAELLLPIALKLFPNLLPSTYESGSDKEKKLKKLRKTRKSVSEFLRETVSESGVSLPENITEEQQEQFTKFFKATRSAGEKPSKELIVSVARLFKDDTVLDNLSRPQLVAMAKYMNLQAFGTNMVLRYLIRHRMLQIKQDDSAIDFEGVESLSVAELQQACASRGIRTHKVPPAKLREDLGLWLELRLHQKVPSTILILSSAYTYGSTESIDNYYDAIAYVLAAIPQELYHEAELQVQSVAATNKQRLEVLKEQQELIEDENDEEKESGHIIKISDRLPSLDDHPEKPAEHAEPKAADDVPAETVSEAADPAAQDKPVVHVNIKEKLEENLEAAKEPKATDNKEADNKGEADKTEDKKIEDKKTEDKKSADKKSADKTDADKKPIDTPAS